MKILSALLILVACAGCQTSNPSRTTDLPPPPLVRLPPRPALETGTVDIVGVHGQVEYWDCFHWASLRPGLVLTNLAQIRPGPDSRVDMRHDHCVTVRLVADHRLNVQAWVVRHLKAVQSAPAAPALEGGATSFIVNRTSGLGALQIQAGGILGRQQEEDFAIYPDGKVEAVKGKVMVTGRGTTWALRNGEFLAAGADALQKESLSQTSQMDAPACTMLPWLVVSLPKSVPFDLLTMNSWRANPGLGE